MDHVAAVLQGEVRIECSSRALKDKLAALAHECSQDDDEVDLCLAYESREELAGLLSQLQALGLLFGSEPEGGSPMDVFTQLRDEGLVKGVIKTLTWRGRGDAILGEA